jgi:hypothetical protein
MGLAFPFLGEEEEGRGTQPSKDQERKKGLSHATL